MESIFEKLKEIYSNTEQWDYYKNRPLNNWPNFSVDNDFANKFIRKYFESGEKEFVLNSFDVDVLSLLGKRSLHTVTTFFIGIMLKEGLPKEEFANSKLFRENNKDIFLYCWFITCLFHDYGYIIENNKEKYPPNEFESTKLGKKLSINQGFDYIYEKYDADTIKKYSAYIKDTRKRLDHGIIGG